MEGGRKSYKAVALIVLPIKGGFVHVILLSFLILFWVNWDSLDFCLVILLIQNIIPNSERKFVKYREQNKVNKMTFELVPYNIFVNSLH